MTEKEARKIARALKHIGGGQILAYASHPLVIWVNPSTDSRTGLIYKCHVLDSDLCPLLP